MKWLLIFVTLNSEKVIGEFPTYQECQKEAREYFDPSFRNEIFVCREGGK